MKAKRFYLLAGMVASLAIGTAGAQELAEKRAEDAQSVLFIGNSFTYGAHSAVQRYRADTVDDLDITRVGADTRIEWQHGVILVLDQNS